MYGWILLFPTYQVRSGRHPVQFGSFFDPLRRLDSLFFFPPAHSGPEALLSSLSESVTGGEAICPLCAGPRWSPPRCRTQSCCAGRRGGWWRRERGRRWRSSYWAPAPWSCERGRGQNKTEVGLRVNTNPTYQFWIFGTVFILICQLLLHPVFWLQSKMNYVVLYFPCGIYYVIEKYEYFLRYCLKVRNFHTVTKLVSTHAKVIPSQSL